MRRRLDWRWVGVVSVLALMVHLGPTLACLYAATNGLIAYPARDTSGNQNIFFIRSDGTGKVQKTAGADNALPSWSPTGTQLAYVYRDPTTMVSYVCIMNADGSGQHPISEGTTPAWSPDGTWIAYTSARSGSAELWVMSPDGSNQRQVTANERGTGKYFPTWSPDGQQIAYAQADDIHSHVAIWLVDISGANQHQLTTGTWNNLDLNGNIINSANDANSPAWSPTSGRIAFWSGVEGQNGQVWIINSDGTGRTQLTHAALPSHNDDPEWSPDGQEILFSTDRATGQPELWVMSSDGSDQHKITDNTPLPLPADSSWQPIDAAHLWLSGGRYQVSTVWQTAGGNSGPGQAVALTEDTGYFWFFSDSNVEMLVKVVNGCSLNQSYWFFAGGLTNVQVTTSVKDTQTGVMKTYLNRQGEAFVPVQDTNAFATCP